MDKKFYELKSPEELLEFMTKNIRYGFISNDGNVYDNPQSEEWELNWYDKGIVQNYVSILKTGIGTCWDQVELERKWFLNHNYRFKTYYLFFENDKPLPTHTFLVYEVNSKYYWFENAFESERGIHEFNNLENLLNIVKEKQFKYAMNYSEANLNDKDDMKCFEFNIPMENIDIKEYLNLMFETFYGTRELLINNFRRISAIPRQSGNEEKIADFFVDVAKRNNLYYYKDKNNNVLIKKKGCISCEPIALQAHLDMVCVKEASSKHNFEEDGIEVIIDGDEVTAKGTSLGADQGVGLSMILSILEDNSLKHPDLEIILTTEEETTFNGVVTFPYSKVNSRRIINLDNSRDDVIFVGADGDICNEYSFKGNLIRNDYPSYKIVITGFQGGNSGNNINLSQNNAITTMAQVLNNKDILLNSINGGLSENDIATTCEVVLNTNLNVNEMFENCEFKIEKIENNFCFSKADTSKIINQILDLKCGYVIKNSVSANLGLIKTCNDEVKICYVIRSSNEKDLEEINNKCNNLTNDFQNRELYRDSIWEKDESSNLLKKYKEIYYSEYRNYPKEEIGRCSIECAAIKKRINGLDIISIGSNMENIHTTKEKTYINSWIKIYKLLLKTLENF